MAGAGEGLGADQLLLAQIDLRLIPEFDPALRQGVAKIDAAGDGRRMAEIVLLQEFEDDIGLERLTQPGQHLQLLLLANAFDMREYGRAAIAHQLDAAAIAIVAERNDATDRFRGFDGDVEKDDVRRAPRQSGEQPLTAFEFLGVDARTVQNEREKMPDAGVAVDDITKRRARCAVGFGRSATCSGN